MRMSLASLRVVRAMLADPSAQRYGLELTRETGVQAGTLYPILTRLEKAGWLEGGWEAIDEKLLGRRARRYYKLTALGLREARRALTREGMVVGAPGVLHG